MKIYQNNNNWIIEDQLSDYLTEKIKNFINDNLNNILKDDEGYSNIGKNADLYWLIKLNSNYNYTHEKFENIKIEYKNQILERLKNSEILNEKIKKKVDLDNLNCWSVIGKENSYHAAHCHSIGNLNGICTVLYLNVPETNLPKKLDNDIFLIMNSNFLNNFYENFPNIVNINPKIGKILIFPDWLIHGTYSQSSGIRQTFNMDYKIKTNNNTTINYT